MPRVEAIGDQVIRLLEARPFKPFALVVESGEQLIIEHLENIAFDPTGADGTEDFYVATRRLRTVSTFSAVTSISQLRGAELSN